jgi:raffinose/stachyose/melibiose transport system permease protein
MRNKRKFYWMTPIALLIAFFHMIPIYITFVVAVSKYGENKSYWALPKEFQFNNFIEAFNTGELLIAFKNTFFITVISVILVIIIGAMAAYPLARNKSKLNSMVINGILAIMMIPALSLLVPLYTFMVDIHGVNTYWGIIILHVTFQLPICIFLLKNFISSIPVELDEAALIDGCSVFKIFYKIILPLLKPVITTITILTGVGIWNDYSNSLYFLQDESMKTLTLAISSFFSQTNQNPNIAAAGALIAIVPIVIIYIILQKTFIKGAVDSAIK